MMNLIGETTVLETIKNKGNEKAMHQLDGFFSL